MSKKRLSSLLLLQLAAIFAMLAFLTVSAQSCSRRDRFTSDGRTIIYFWHIYPDNDPDRAFINRLVAEFEEQNPDIVVEQHGINFWDYYTALNIIQSGGGRDAPDVFFQTIASIPQRARRISMNLVGFLRDDDDIHPDNFPADEVKVAFYDNGLYGVPFSADARYLFYNRTMLREAGFVDEHGEARAPRTLEEMYEMARALTRVNATNTGYETIGFNPNMGNNNLMNFIWPQGGNAFDENGMPTTLTDPVIGDAFMWWRRFVQIYRVAWYNALVSSSMAMGDDGGGDRSVFINGHVGMVIHNMTMAHYINMVDNDLDWGVAPIPFAEGYQTSFAGGFSLEVAQGILSEYRGRETAEKAWRLVRFLTSFEVQTRLFGEMGIMPALISAGEYLIHNDDTLTENQRRILYLSRYRRQFDYIPAWPNWFSIYGTHLSNFQVGRGGHTLDATLRMIDDELREGIERHNRLRR